MDRGDSDDEQYDEDADDIVLGRIEGLEDSPARPDLSPLRQDRSDEEGDAAAPGRITLLFDLNGVLVEHRSQKKGNVWRHEHTWVSL